MMGINKLAKHIWILCFVLVFGLFIPTSVQAADDSINSIDITVLLMDDGSAQITQVWDTTRASGTEGYIPQTGLGDIEITDFGVTDETGSVYENIGSWDVNASLEEKANKCGINETSDGIELCWGIGSYGNHTYTLTYTMTNFIKHYSDDTFGFYSRFINDELSSPPDHVQVTIQRPNVALNADNAGIWGFGYIGDINFTDGSVVAKSTEALQSSSHVTVLMRLDSDIVANAAENEYTFEQIEKIAKDGSDYDTGNSDDTSEETELPSSRSTAFGVISNLVRVFGTLIIIFLFGLLFKRGNSSDPKRGNAHKIKDSNVSYYRDIPMNGELSASYFALDYYKNLPNKSSLVSAYFLRWIKLGYVTLDTRETKGLLGLGKKNETSLILKMDTAHQITDPVEKRLFRFINEAAGDDHILQEKELKKWSSKHYNTLSDWFTSAKTAGKNLFDDNGWLSTEQRTAFFGLHKYQVKDVNPEGYQQSLNLLGFKKYLLDFTLVNEREAKEVHLWDDYLIFAALFDCADTVAKQFKELNPRYIESSAYMQNDMDFFMTYMFINSISRSSYNAMRSAQASAESRSSGGGGSSSFGGGGGGFSGGGSGGGFR